jgi:hypothetical protein
VCSGHGYLLIPDKRAHSSGCHITARTLLCPVTAAVVSGMHSATPICSSRYPQLELQLCQQHSGAETVCVCSCRYRGGPLG